MDVADGAWERVIKHHLRATREKDLPKIRDQVIERLRKHGDDRSGQVEDEIDNTLEKTFLKSTKELLANALASVFWTCLTEHLMNPAKPSQRVTQKGIATGLGVAPSNLGRWGKETLPNPNKFFLA